MKKKLFRLLDRNNPELPPRGMLTIRQWAAREGLSHVHMGQIIRQLVSEKKMRMQKYRTNTSDRLMSLPHYALIKGK